MPLGTEGGLGAGDVVLDGDPAPSTKMDTQMGTQLPHGKGHSSLRSFRRMSIVAKRSPISTTAEILWRSSRQSVSIL